MQQYLDACKHVLEIGEIKKNRTGVDTLAVFGYQRRFDLREGFPIVTTKKVAFNLVVKELLWFLRGETNIKTLGCKIWDQWATEEGELPYCYGQMWRSWPGREREVDQIKELIDGLLLDPTSRRPIICAWHPEYSPKDTGLAHCHVLAQFNISGGYVDCALTQRSCDLGLGVPFNISSYCLLLAMVAKRLGRVPRAFVHTYNDMHIYVNHISSIQEQLTREPLPLPQLVLHGDQTKELWDYKEEDIELIGYQHHPAIKLEIAV